MKWAILMACLLATGGCQQMVWYRPDTSPDEEQHDLSQATRDAIRAANAPPPVTYVVVTDNSREAAADAAGAAIGDAIATAIKEVAIINQEMQSKGYRLITEQEAARLSVDDAGYYSNAPPSPQSYSNASPDPNAPIYPNPP